MLLLPSQGLPLQRGLVKLMHSMQEYLQETSLIYVNLQDMIGMPPVPAKAPPTLQRLVAALAGL